MSRRANGEGSVYQRKDGRWVASLSIGRGKRKHFFGTTRTEASEKLTAALKAQNDGLPVITERQRFSEFAASWLTAVKSSLKPRTWLRYEQLLRVHALPAFGQVWLEKLTPQHLQRHYAQMESQGAAPATVRQFHAVVHRALRQAMRWNLVVRNVADLVTAPRVPRTEMKVLSPEEAKRLLDYARGDPLEALYVLALTTGMRQGEVLALHWRDVDLDRGTLQIRLTLQRMRKGFAFTEPKSSRSRRQITLTVAAQSALKQHRTDQAAQRLVVGPAWQDQDLVFPGPTGGPIDGTTLLRQHFQPLLAKSGLPTVRFHDLRHTAATLLLGEGIHPKIVSEMLGHSNIAITLDLYSHVTPTMQQQAATALDSLLARS